MNRIRSIHPGFFKSRIATLKTAARLLFIGLWTVADDWGVFPWEPWKLKAELFPVDGSVDEIESYLNDLVRLGVIEQFQSDGKVYGAIRNFARFQRPKRPNQLYPCPASLFGFLGFSAAGERPREMAKSLTARPAQEFRTGAEPRVPNSFPNSLPDNRKERDIPSRVELRYLGSATGYDFTWSSDLS